MKLIFVTITSLLIFCVVNMVAWTLLMQFLSNANYSAASFGAWVRESSSAFIFILNSIIDVTSEKAQFHLFATMALGPLMVYLPWDETPRLPKIIWKQINEKIFKVDSLSQEEVSWAKIFERIDFLETHLLEQRETAKKLRSSLSKFEPPTDDYWSRVDQSLKLLVDRTENLTNAIMKIFRFTTSVSLKIEATMYNPNIVDDMDDLLSYIEVYVGEQKELENVIKRVAEHLDERHNIHTKKSLDKISDLTALLEAKPLEHEMIVGDLRKAAQAMIRRTPDKNSKKIAQVMSQHQTNELEDLEKLTRRSITIQEKKTAPKRKLPRQKESTI